MFNFIRNCQNVFAKHLYRFASLPIKYESSVRCSIFLLALGHYFSLSSGYTVVSHCSFSLPLFNDEWRWAFSNVFIWLVYTFFTEVSIQIFCPMFIGFVVAFVSVELLEFFTLPSSDLTSFHLSKTSENKCPHNGQFTFTKTENNPASGEWLNTPVVCL